MFLTYPSTILRDTGLPHVRGGVSTHQGVGVPHPVSSPRAWGCFSSVYVSPRRLFVFPTCVGVFLTRPRRLPESLRLPHVRGGVSKKNIHAPGLRRSSPRAWGCFLRWESPEYHGKVFPTCVGVFLRKTHNPLHFCSLPHVRGGVSKEGEKGTFPKTSSPRAWGCFYQAADAMSMIIVFPTCVGVFPAF